METSEAARYQRIRYVLIVVLLLNWGVALAKIIYGLISRCESMVADGFHSLADGASNIIGLIGIHLARQPIDKDHPYGHKKYETLFSMGIGMLLTMVCFNLFKEGLTHLRQPVVPHIDMRSFTVMLLTLAVNIGVMKYEYARGKALQSDILVSDSMHTKADIFTSVSVIIALIGIKLGFPILDPIATLVIALFIAYTAYEIFRENSQVLCDKAAIIDEQKIYDVVRAIKGVKTCHKIRSRGRSDDIYIDLHVQVSPSMHVDEAHKVSYAIEGALKRAIPAITDVVVHIEPREEAPPD